MSINTNYYLNNQNYLNNQSVSSPNPKLLQQYMQSSVFDIHNTQAAQSSEADVNPDCTDGVDDGCISFGETAKSFFKGCSVTSNQHV